MNSRVAFPNLQEIYPSRIVIAGDWHRHHKAIHALKVIDYANRIGADGIVHVGDLGFNFDWNKHSHGGTFEKPLRNALEQNDMFMVWIDGNHENHTWLRELPVREDGFAQTGAGGRIFWAPRGHRWEWFGVKFGALGGAFSVNYKQLIEGRSFFENIEEVQESDLVTLGDEELDVLLTHEVPHGVPLQNQISISEATALRAVKSRILLRKAVEKVKPMHVFSGHWHQKVDYDLVRSDDGISTCHVLDREYSPNNILVLDLHDFTVSEPDKNWMNKPLPIF